MDKVINQEKKEKFPYKFESKVTKQGIITIPHSITLKEGNFYIFEFHIKKTQMHYTQIKKIRGTGNRKYISCRIKMPYLEREDEVTVIILKEFQETTEKFLRINDFEYPLLSNDTNRCMFLYKNRSNNIILTSEEETQFKVENPDFESTDWVMDIFKHLDNVEDKGEEFFDILRLNQYSVIRYFGKKRELSITELTENPTEDARKAYQTFLPYCFCILTKINHLQFLLSHHIRTRIKLFLSKFQSISSYKSFIIKEFSTYLQSDIFERINVSDHTYTKTNSLDDIRFWFYIPSEYQEVAKKIQLEFFSGKKYIEIDKLIDSIVSKSEDLEITTSISKEAIEWFNKHRVLQVKTKDKKKVLERFGIE